jgi:hypothetical protein
MLKTGILFLFIFKKRLNLIKFYRFIFFDCSSPGSTHDSVAFGKTKLFPIVESGLLQSHWIACDSAYPLIGSLMKPFEGRARDDPWEDSYNYHLSNLRITIEDTFGIFVQMWRIFWGPLECTPLMAIHLICAITQLHNFIIDVDGFERCKRILKDEEKHLFKPWWQDKIAVGEPFSTETQGDYGTLLRQRLVQMCEECNVMRPSL